VSSLLCHVTNQFVKKKKKINNSDDIYRRFKSFLDLPEKAQTLQQSRRKINHQK
jgi:hypothetical protein